MRRKELVLRRASVRASWIWPGKTLSRGREDPGGRKSAPVGLGCCKKREGCSSRKWILEENGEQLNRMFHRGEVQGVE